MAKARSYCSDGALSPYEARPLAAFVTATERRRYNKTNRRSLELVVGSPIENIVPDEEFAGRPSLRSSHAAEIAWVRGHDHRGAGARHRRERCRLQRYRSGPTALASDARPGTGRDDLGQKSGAGRIDRRTVADGVCKFPGMAAPGYSVRSDRRI